jgi:hypothetical protein
LQNLNDSGVNTARDTPTPLPTINAKIINMVVKWCEYHVVNVLTSRNYFKKSKEIQEWERHFLHVDKDIFFDIMRAANINRRRLALFNGWRYR